MIFNELKVKHVEIFFMPLKTLHIFVILVNVAIDCRVKRVFIDTIFNSENYLNFSFLSKQYIGVGIRDLLKTYNTKYLNNMKCYIHDVFECLCSVSNKMNLCVYIKFPYEMW